jgi:FkbM family methyltransferase
MLVNMTSSGQRNQDGASRRGNRTLALTGILVLLVGVLLGQGVTRFLEEEPEAASGSTNPERPMPAGAKHRVGWILRDTVDRAVVPELMGLVHKWGPPQYSWHAEETVVRDFFQDRRGGFFLDVGAGHYQSGNNTYYLEKELDWKGIGVDPQTSFAAAYQQHRPGTRYVAAFVSDEDDEKRPFFLIHNDVTNSMSSGEEKAAKQSGREVTEVDVTTVTLNTLLDKLGVKKVDFLSMDIELWEPAALAGFDIRKYGPELVCIEAHKPVRYQIQDYFARHDYHMIGEYALVDGWNWYFAPREEVERRKDRELRESKLALGANGYRWTNDSENAPDGKVARDSQAE